METLAPLARREARLRFVTNHPTEFLDLTQQLDRLVAESGVETGLLNVQSLHTTTAIVVNEHEPLLLEDFRDFLEQAAPRDFGYRHDDTSIRTVNLTAAERPNGHSHCRALLLPSSVCLNVAQGRPLLGTWQRVFLVELDGPREREISVMLIYGVLRRLEKIRTAVGFRHPREASRNDASGT